MSISKSTTITSGVLAIARDVRRNDQETLDIELIKAGPNHKDKILVVDVESEKVSNYDEVVQSIYDGGFGIVISDVFTEMFSAKAINYGILTIEVSREFLDKILIASRSDKIKLFVDFNGQEVMIVNTGQKEFFDMSDYNKMSFKGGDDDVENLYDIWEDMGNLCQPDELLAYIEGRN